MCAQGAFGRRPVSQPAANQLSAHGGRFADATLFSRSSSSLGRRSESTVDSNPQCERRGAILAKLSGCRATRAAAAPLRCRASLEASAFVSCGTTIFWASSCPTRPSVNCVSLSCRKTLGLRRHVPPGADLAPALRGCTPARHGRSRRCHATAQAHPPACTRAHEEEHAQ